MMNVHLFDAKSIHSLKMEGKENQGQVTFLESITKEGISQLMRNISGELLVLKVGNIVFPLLIPDQSPDNSYVCSPYHHYVSYGLKFTSEMKESLLARLGKTGVEKIGKIIHLSKMDQAVYVNHWLLSTDLYPKGFTKEHVKAIVAFLKKRYPHQAIIFRSLNKEMHHPLIDDFKKCGFDLIVSRQILMTDTKNDEIFKTRILKSDLRLFDKKPFEMHTEAILSPSDSLQICKLYHQLNIECHSSLNPQPNESFIQTLLSSQFLEFKVLKKNNDILGIAGFHVKNGILMCPFFGYDTSFKEHKILYRLLSTALLLEAKKRNAVFHQSAGATFYKKIRRAKSCLESMAVYSSHLPYRQKLGWKGLKYVMNTFAPFFMKRY